MKRLSQLWIWLFLLPSLAVGQGTFVFNNSSTALVVSPTIYGTNTPTSSALGAKVEILWAPLGTTDLNLFQLASVPVSVGVVAAGRFNGGTFTIPAGTGFFGIAPGDTVAAYIRGWTGNYNSWNEALGSPSWIGWSSLFTIDTGDPTLIPQGTPANINTSTATPFTGMYIGYIPEPSAAAILSAGLVALMWRRLQPRAARIPTRL